MKTLPVFLALAFTLGVACITAPKPDAKPTAKPGTTSPVPDAIATAKAEAQAALAAVEKKVSAAEAQLAALEKRSAVAAAQVDSLRTANTNQQPGPATSVVAGEAALALGNLPTPDVQAALEAEKRRAATFAGQVEEARKLYASAQTETERMKAEAAKLRADTTQAKAEADAARIKAEAAQVSLNAAEQAHTATLERNKAENQAKIDAAVKRADEAEAKAYAERQNLLVRILIGIGALSILAGIGLAIATSGASVWRSGIAVLCGGICFGLAKVLSHPWFNTIFVTSLVLLAAAGAVFLWHERKSALAKEAFTRTVAALDETGVVFDDEGKKTELGNKLEEALDTPHKKLVATLQKAAAIKEAKAL